MSPRHLGLLLLTLLLTACAEPDARDMLEDYATRVGNALEEPVGLDLDQALAQRAALPPRRDRLFEIATVREGLIDVLDFRHCDLLHAIAERNSALGRVATGSQRLIYELQMLPALRACRSRLDQQDELAPRLRARLDDIIALKQRSLPRLVWNALYTSAEMEQQFTLNSPPLPLEGHGLLAPLQPALQHFADIAALTHHDDWQPPAFTPTLEQDFEALYRSDFGARWLTSMTLLTHTLERTADAIERRLARRQICFNRQPNNRARIIRNVFQTYYAGALQPYLSLVHRQGQRWIALQQQILQPLPIPAASQDYFNALFGPGSDSLWQHYLQARDRHTRNWQQLLRQCGMMPGQA